MSTPPLSATPEAPARVRPPRPRPVPAATGLCRLCTAAPGCTFPRDPSRPVLHCDEAVLSPAPVPSPFGHAASPAPAPAAGSEVRGLCVNCDNRGHCTLPKPEGGVWRCEEYV